MISRLKNLFLRYKAQHFKITGPGFPLKSKHGRLIGHVDRVWATHNEMTLQGWCQAEQVSLITNGGGTARVRPNIPRTDVSDAYGGSSKMGFQLSEAYGNGRYTLLLEDRQLECRPLHIRPIPRRKSIWAMATLFFGFLTDLLRALPAMCAWWLRQDFDARMRVKAQLGLALPSSGNVLDAGLLKGLASASNSQVSVCQDSHCVTIVLPIFNAFDLLPEVLDRVKNNTDLAWRLILIEDCSTDENVRPWLRQWVSEQRDLKDNVLLIENDRNLGFIGSVNRGLDLAKTFVDHVILLNSDAFVPKDWASRLLAPILENSSVASTTPMSNDAEIFSIPRICHGVDLAPGDADLIDATARNIPVRKDWVEVPTAVGFCMAMNNAFLQKRPEFDPVFGRGYGEEVDWCQAVRRMKGRHVAVPNLFVEHRGGSSFGSEEKQVQLVKNNQIIEARYPGYDSEVQAFVASDPLITPRLILAVAWAGQHAKGRALPIYLAHSLGGGADLYLNHRMAQDWEYSGLPSIVLRVGGVQRWQIEVVCGQESCVGMLEDIGDVLRLLAPIPRRRIIYSCGVGDRDPQTLPQHLLSLKASARDEVEILVHDYFMISPNYTLLNAEGVFNGPNVASQASFGDRVSQPAWVQEWNALVAEATKVRVFSQCSREIFLDVFPAARHKIKLEPHDLLVAVPRLSPPASAGQKQVVAVLGNVGFHKGAQVVCDLGRLLQNTEDMSLIVLGEFDPLFDLPKTVKVLGGYDLRVLPDLARKHRVTQWLIPSIWPETFSYTTHEALATGLPTHAFALGSQGDAARRSMNGHVIAYGPGEELARNALLSLRRAHVEKENPLRMAAGL